MPLDAKYFGFKTYMGSSDSRSDVEEKGRDSDKGDEQQQQQQGDESGGSTTTASSS